MPFHDFGEIRYFTFESFEDSGIPHGILSRHGGFSPNPWASLNVGATVGDDSGRVQANRQLSFQAIGRSLESLFDVWQVHSTEVVCTDSPRPPGVPHLKADAILTDRPGVTLFMRFADCVPIFLFDPVRHVVGLVHAGWKGTVDKAVEAAVHVMKRRYLSNPADILAGIGPSIGAHHYEVGPEVAALARTAFGMDAAALVQPKDRNPAGETKVQFDLWAANRLILENLGVRYIEMSEICTACNLSDWYSHRAEKGRTGRFGTLIGL